LNLLDKTLSFRLQRLRGAKMKRLETDVDQANQVCLLEIYTLYLSCQTILKKIKITAVLI